MLLKIGIIAGVVMFCFTAIVTLAVLQSGFLIIDIKDTTAGKRIFLPLPMFAVNLTMDLIPDYRLRQFSGKLPAPAFLMQQTGKNLYECPDGVFVDIRKRHDHVTIEKRNGSFIVDAVNDDHKIFVQVPIASTTRALSRLAQFSESQTERQ